METQSEKEKMLGGALYDPLDAELVAARRRARNLLHALNSSRDDEQERRRELLRALLGGVAEGIWVEPPFFCDYGANITLGGNIFFNFNCVILDPAAVRIGSNVLFGPGVHVYTASHPMSALERRRGLEFARPVEIGADVWVGGGVIICPGVRIGAATVIGAGSVVTRDLPGGVFAAGNPCRVIRDIDDRTTVLV